MTNAGVPVILGGRMIVKEVMRPTRPVWEGGTLHDVLEAIQASGSEVVPIVGKANGRAAVRQLVGVRDLPKLTELARWGNRGHAVGRTVQDLLSALGRKPGRIPTLRASNEMPGVAEAAKIESAEDAGRPHTRGGMWPTEDAGRRRFAAASDMVGVLLEALSPKSTVADAWGLMCEECLTHLPVVDQGEVVGIVSLVVTWNEFPHNSPIAGFLA